jgi:hypothetical protein
MADAMGDTQGKPVLSRRYTPYDRMDPEVNHKVFQTACFDKNKYRPFVTKIL